jgi:hypothetical protein
VKNSSAMRHHFFTLFLNPHPHQHVILK